MREAYLEKNYLFEPQKKNESFPAVCWQAHNATVCWQLTKELGKSVKFVSSVSEWKGQKLLGRAKN